jgi:5-methylcytosine-specific restriction endonuclease McrA
MSRGKELRGFWKPQRENVGESAKQKFRVWKKAAKKKREKFYRSREWLELRFRALVFYGRRCMCCGAGPEERLLQVDHVKSRHKYPELSLDIKNLQILCSTCNQGKSWHSESDFRNDFLTDEQLQHLKDM